MAFGTDWKDNLTELSGGQRSLLALSLILALNKSQFFSQFLFSSSKLSGSSEKYFVNIISICSQNFGNGKI